MRRTAKLPVAILRLAAKVLPVNFFEIVYTVLCRPRPLRRAVNWILLKLIPEQISVDGVSLWLNPRDPVLSSALAFGIYETFEQDVFRDLCKPGAIVVDIGANIGLYTAIGAARVGKDGRVIALEPHPESYRCLQKTIAENGLTQVKSFCVAAGDSRRQIPLFLTDDNQADSRIYDSSGVRQQTPAQMIDLDRLLAENGIDRVDVIKMDIQGAEALALEGMRKTLARNPKVVVVAEFWPWGIEQTGLSAPGFLLDLQKAGFRFRTIDEIRRRVEDVEDIGQIIAEHASLQYTGMDLRRSHANLICVRDGSAGERNMNDAELSGASTR